MAWLERSCRAQGDDVARRDEEQDGFEVPVRTWARPSARRIASEVLLRTALRRGRRTRTPSLPEPGWRSPRRSAHALREPGTASNPFAPFSPFRSVLPSSFSWAATRAARRAGREARPGAASPPTACADRQRRASAGRRSARRRGTTECRGRARKPLPDSVMARWASDDPFAAQATAREGGPAAPGGPWCSRCRSTCRRAADSVRRSRHSWTRSAPERIVEASIRGRRHRTNDPMITRKCPPPRATPRAHRAASPPPIPRDLRGAARWKREHRAKQRSRLSEEANTLVG